MRNEPRAEHPCTSQITTMDFSLFIGGGGVGGGGPGDSTVPSGILWFNFFPPLQEKEGLELGSGSKQSEGQGRLLTPVPWADSRLKSLLPGAGWSFSHLAPVP